VYGADGRPVAAGSVPAQHLVVYQVPLATVGGLYVRFGDWVPKLALLLALTAAAYERRAGSGGRARFRRQPLISATIRSHSRGCAARRGRRAACRCGPRREGQADLLDSALAGATGTQSPRRRTVGCPL